MAKKVCFCAEHLQCLTLSIYGRSPIKQLNWLRLQGAADPLPTAVTDRHYINEWVAEQ